MSLLNDMLRDLSQPHKNPETKDAGENFRSSAQNQVATPSAALLRSSTLMKADAVNVWPSLLVFVFVSLGLLAWKENIFPAKNDKPLVIAADTASEKTQTGFADHITANDQAASNANAQLRTAGTENSTELPTGNEVAEEKNSNDLLNERLAALETAITTLSTVVQNANAPQPISQIASADGSIDTSVHEANEENSESVSIRDPFSPSNGANTEGILPDVEPVPADAQLAITPNPTFADERQAQQARELITQGQVSEAISSLRQFVATGEAPKESALVLLDMLSQQQDAPAIMSLLNQAHYLSDLDKRFYAAKAAIIQDKEIDAVQLLETKLADAEAHENYRALLAGLYQRTGRFTEAAAAYRRLLTSFGEKPAYWLGFALAQDSLNQAQTAKQAYRRLAEYSGLQPEVRAYIQQRLTALQ